MRAWRCLIALLICAPCTFVVPAQAMKVTPFKVRLEPSGYQSSQLFMVENDSDQKIAVELSAVTRDLDDSGAETNADASADFSVYPSQVIVEPHSSKSVRVQWNGPAQIDKEKAYRLIAEELPVNLDPGHDANAVRFLVQYRCAMYITPPQARSDVKMTAYALDGHTLNFTLANNGTAHSLIKNFALVLTDSAGHSHELSDPKVLERVNSEVLMPGAQRRFSVLLPADAGVDVKDVTFHFAEAF